MNGLFSKISSKYLRQDIFKYVSFNTTIKIIKYNKKLIHELNYTVFEIKNFLFFHKIIKPISNIEDYIPIIKRMLPSKDNNENNINNIIKILCKYLNANNQEFIPQINKIKGNEFMLDNINYFKIGFCNTFLDYFYHEDNELDFNVASEFCKKYGKKIKEITFMDNNLPHEMINDEAYFLMAYIIKKSNIQKIEDNYSFEYKSSIFTYIFNNDFSAYCEKYKDILKEDKNNIKDLNSIMTKIKSYSLYFDEGKNEDAINSFNDIVVNNGHNIEELEIASINRNNYTTFINSLKKLKNLKSLKIPGKSKYVYLHNKISEVIKKDSLITLEMNIKSFDGGIKIINKNLDSLRELTIKIDDNSTDNIKIIKNISKIVNLKKLRIIADFLIFNEANIGYLYLNEVEYLEIPLHIIGKIFDLNAFFERIPKLKTLIFYDIDFNTKSPLQENIKILENLQFSNNNLKFLKRIHFIKSKKSASFFVKKLLDIFLLNEKTKENIKEIKIEKCEFNGDILFRDLIQEISLFPNLKNLSLNGNKFEKGDELIYDEINNFENLEEFNFKGLDYEQNEIKILYFLYKFSEKCKKIHELSFSCKGLNPYDFNIIFVVAKNYKLLTKLNIFDNYSEHDYYSNKEDCSYKQGINIGEIDNYCLYDLRNINLKKMKKLNSSFCYIDYNKNIINDNLLEKQKVRFVNEKEKYFSYQKVFVNDSNSNKLFYLKKEKSFIIGNINDVKI